MVFDESVWVAIGFILFILLVAKKATKAVTALLDARTEKIRSEIDYAQALHKEAKEQYQHAKTRKENAETHAQQIKENAHIVADQLVQQAKLTAEKDRQRQEKQAEDRRKADETALTQTVKNEVAQAAIAVTEDIITKQMSETKALHIIDRNLDTLSKKKPLKRL